MVQIISFLHYFILPFFLQFFIFSPIYRQTLINLLEAIRRRFKKNNEKHLHITLIEEAHRLLSKPQPGEINKQHGVDTFTDMLAEIRKYGESLIIADQIPNK
jgi:pantothenate kinase type III